MNFPVSAVLGILAPALISYLKNVTWPVWARVLVTFGVCAALGVISVTVSGTMDTSDYVASVGTIFTVATVFYQTYFANTQINADLESQIYPKSVKTQAAERMADDADNALISAGIDEQTK